MAEDAWNSRDPVRVSLAYTEDSIWRNRSEFVQGRAAIVEFLTRKWQKEQDYRLIKDLWAFDLKKEQATLIVRIEYLPDIVTVPVVERERSQSPCC